MRTSRKAMMAVAITLAMLAMLASPAAANPDRGDLTVGGEVRFHTSGNFGSPTYRIPYPDDGTGPECNPQLPTGSIDLATAGTNANGTWSATTPNPPGPIKSLFTVTGSGNVYQVDATIIVASGTYGPPPPSGYTHGMSSSPTNHMILQLKFHRQTGSSPFSCVKTDLRCTLNTKVLLQPGSAFNGTLPGASGGETLRWVFSSDVSGGVPLTPAGTCDSDLSSIPGKHITGTVYFTFP